jgi:hypothetical protein
MAYAAEFDDIRMLQDRKELRLLYNIARILCILLQPAPSQRSWRRWMANLLSH